MNRSCTKSAKCAVKFSQLGRIVRQSNIIVRHVWFAFACSVVQALQFPLFQLLVNNCIHLFLCNILSNKLKSVQRSYHSIPLTVTLIVSLLHSLCGANGPSLYPACCCYLICETNSRPLRVCSGQSSELVCVLLQGINMHSQGTVFLPIFSSYYIGRFYFLSTKNVLLQRKIKPKACLH